MIRVDLLRRLEPEEATEGGTWIRFALIGAGAVLILTVAIALFRDRASPPIPATVRTEERPLLDTDAEAVRVPDRKEDVRVGVQPEGAAAPPEAAGTYASRNVLCLSIFEALERAIPPSVWLTAIHSESSGEYTLEGIAFFQHRVEEFARNLRSEEAVHTSSAQISRDGQDMQIRFVLKGTLTSPGSSEEDRLHPLSTEAAHDLGRAIRREGETLGLRFFGPPTMERISEAETPALRERLHAEGMDSDVGAFLGYLMKELYEPFRVSHLAITPKDREEGAGRLNLVLTLHFYILD